MIAGETAGVTVVGMLLLMWVRGARKRRRAGERDLVEMCLAEGKVHVEGREEDACACGALKNWTRWERGGGGVVVVVRLGWRQTGWSGMAEGAMARKRLKGGGVGTSGKRAEFFLISVSGSHRNRLQFVRPLRSVVVCTAAASVPVARVRCPDGKS